MQRRIGFIVLIGIILTLTALVVTCFYSLQSLKRLYQVQTQNATIYRSQLSRYQVEHFNLLDLLDEDYNKDNVYLHNLPGRIEKLLDSTGYLSTNIFDLELLLRVERSKRRKLQADLDTLNQAFEYDRVNFNSTLFNVRSAAKAKSDSLYALLEKSRKMVNDLRPDTITIKSPQGIPILFFGVLRSGLPSGFGFGYYQKKGWYLGHWSSNMRMGSGIHYFKNGDKYQGHFLNDSRDGFGVYYFEDGGIYRGLWKNDLMHGKGEWILADGKIITGIWNEGKLVE